MKKKVEASKVFGVLLLLAFALFIGVVGYRVIVTSLELPGKLGSVPIAANNLQYYGPSMSKVQKVEYDTMKYGFMEDMQIERMANLDQHYENERMEEVRAINNLTAMSEKTAETLAYQAAKAEREEEIEKAREAARLAAAAEEAKKEAVRKALSGGYDTTVFANGGTDTGSGDTASKGGRIGEPVYASSHGESLGKFVITAYCTCRICCGVYSGGNRTASGTVPTTNRTLAVDTNVIPFGTKLVINGQVYVAEDRGGAIKGKRIDMFFYTHKEALRWGRRTVEVYLAE